MASVGDATINLRVDTDEMKRSFAESLRELAKGLLDAADALESGIDE